MRDSVDVALSRATSTPSKEYSVDREMSGMRGSLYWRLGNVRLRCCSS